MTGSRPAFWPSARRRTWYWRGPSARRMLFDKAFEPPISCANTSHQTEVWCSERWPKPQPTRKHRWCCWMCSERRPSFRSRQMAACLKSAGPPSPGIPATSSKLRRGYCWKRIGPEIRMPCARSRCTAGSRSGIQPVRPEKDLTLTQLKKALRVRSLSDTCQETS